MLHVVAAGHRTSVADLYWLKLVQYVGSPEGEQEGWPELSALARVVTTLDPLFGYAYEAAGIVLARADRLDDSDAIFEQGMRNVPSRWQLPFFLAMNAWHFREDYRRGAELMLAASKLPGSPWYAKELSTRLFSSAGSLSEGIALLDSSIRSADSASIREELVRRRKQLLAEQLLRGLEQAIADHRNAFERLPASLDDLADPEVRRLLEGSPVRESIRFDPQTGAVSSTLLPRRLMVYRPFKVPDALAAP
ncbi:MAG TPA: hypothetical protein VGD74_07000 [Vulgatibacter sp.]